VFNERNPQTTQQQEPVNYEGWTWRGTPTLNAEQSLDDENITTLYLL
jgi:hypothetical protein